MNTALYALRGADLRANNAEVADFLGSVHAVLRRAGYSYKRTLQSALYDREYTRNGRRISLSGWHGTGKWGPAASFFCLYILENGRLTSVGDLKPDGESLEQLRADQTKAMQEILKNIERAAK